MLVMKNQENLQLNGKMLYTNMLMNIMEDMFLFYLYKIKLIQFNILNLIIVQNFYHNFVTLMVFLMVYNVLHIVMKDFQQYLKIL